MRTSPWAAALLLTVPLSTFAAEPPEVIKPGLGSFSAYLKQATPPAEKAVEVSTTAVTPVVVPVPEVAPPVQQPKVFFLRRGELVHSEMQAWAKASGWELLWLPDVSWRVLGNTTVAPGGDVTAAVSEVIGVLREEGRAVRLNISDGNAIMEVISTDVMSNKEMSSD